METKDLIDEFIDDLYRMMDYEGNLPLGQTRERLWKLIGQLRHDDPSIDDGKRVYQ